MEPLSRMLHHNSMAWRERMTRTDISRLGAAIALAVCLVLAAPSPVLAADVACPADAGATALEIHIKGLRSADGLVTVTVYPDDPKRFLAPRSKLSRVRVPAAQPETTVCIEVPKPGVYAVATYHDEDGDTKFNKTFLGFPKEGYGFSRNPGGLIGIPSFSQVKFTAHEGANPLTIDISY